MVIVVHWNLQLLEQSLEVMQLASAHLIISYLKQDDSDYYIVCGTINQLSNCIVINVANLGSQEGLNPENMLGKCLEWKRSRNTHLSNAIGKNFFFFNR